jgi:hypothetical protein
MKDVAPSTGLRQWFGHETDRWQEFRRRYVDELRQKSDLLNELRALARKGPITLVFGAHDQTHNDAVVLREIPKVRFAPDSPLEGGGFEPSVPLYGELGGQRFSSLRQFDLALRCCEGDRRFESCSLQRRVRCQPDFRGRIPSMIVGMPTSRASFLTVDREGSNPPPSSGESRANLAPSLLTSGACSAVSKHP